MGHGSNRPSIVQNDLPLQARGPHGGGVEPRLVRTSRSGDPRTHPTSSRCKQGANSPPEGYREAPGTHDKARSSCTSRPAKTCGSCFEIRCGCKLTRGSNPLLSATPSLALRLAESRGGSSGSPGRGPGFRDESPSRAGRSSGHRRGANHAPALRFDVAAEIGEGAPEANVVVDQNVISSDERASPSCARESRGGTMAPLAVRPTASVTRVRRVMSRRARTSVAVGVPAGRADLRLVVGLRRARRRASRGARRGA